MEDLLLYGSQMSPFVRKVEAVLREKGLSYDFEAVNIMDLPDWYKEIHPLRRIPTLRDRTIATEGVAGTIPDSSAICTYLEAKQPTPRLYPEDAFERGRAVWIEEYVDSSLAATGGFGIFRAVMFPLFSGGESDIETARETWNKKLPRHFDYLESVLDGQEYFIGGAFSIADISVAAQMMQVDLIAGAPDASRWPALVAHLEAMKARSCFEKNLEGCRAAISKVLPEPVDLS